MKRTSLEHSSDEGTDPCQGILHLLKNYQPKVMSGIKHRRHNIFTYFKYNQLLQNTAYEVGTNHHNKEMLCYIWQMSAGPIHYSLDDSLLEYWFPSQSDNFYIQAHNFIWTHEPAGHYRDYQTTLIPWVQSIVIKHYVLVKEKLFQAQDYYRFCDTR
jgi:hypothetical protein